jgi:hypothetical protein
VAIENSSAATNSCGLLVKTADLSATSYVLKADSGGVNRFAVQAGGTVTLGPYFAVLADGRVGIGPGTPGGAAVHLNTNFHSSGTVAIDRTISPSGPLFYMADTYTSHAHAMCHWVSYNTNPVTPIILLQNQAAVAIQIYAATTFCAISMNDQDFGAGAQGCTFFAGRNTNASNPAAGTIRFASKPGGSYFIWPDAAGQLRIGGGTPTGGNDMTGTVVGNQTSSPADKQNVKPVTQDERTAVVQRLFHAPLFTYEIKAEVEAGIVGHKHLGFMNDQIPQWMWHDGNTIDPHRVSMELLVGLQELADFVGYTPSPPQGPPERRK